MWSRGSGRRSPRARHEPGGLLHRGGAGAEVGDGRQEERRAAERQQQHYQDHQAQAGEEGEGNAAAAETQEVILVDLFVLFLQIYTIDKNDSPGCAEFCQVDVQSSLSTMLGKQSSRHSNGIADPKKSEDCRGIVPPPRILHQYRVSQKSVHF